MLQKMIAVAALALLVGCAHNPMIWQSGTFSQEQFDRDNYACIQESRTSWSGGGGGLIGIAVMLSAKSAAENQAHDLYCMCMRSKGYTGTEAK